jgi:hypothetical protein
VKNVRLKARKRLKKIKTSRSGVTRIVQKKEQNFAINVFGSHFKAHGVANLLIRGTPVLLS